MKIRFKNVLILTIIFLIATAVFTNPKKDAYVSWCKEEAATQASNSIEKSVIAVLGGPLIQNSTITHNYIIFSIYNTFLDNEKLKVLGIFNNFIPISKANSNGKVNTNSKGA